MASAWTWTDVGAGVDSQLRHSGFVPQKGATSCTTAIKVYVMYVMIRYLLRNSFGPSVRERQKKKHSGQEIVLKLSLPCIPKKIVFRFVLPNLEGSTARTATLWPCPVNILPKASMNVLFPAPGGPDKPDNVIQQVRSE